MSAPSCAVCATPVTRTGKVRAYSCHDCGKTLCETHAEYYIDSSNIAITDNSPAYCHDCYVVRHGVPVSWPVMS